MTAQPPMLFALGSSRGYGERVAVRLGIQRSQDQEYQDGEHKLRPDVDVQGWIVFVVASLYGEPTCSVHDKLDDLLFFIGALKDAAADHVTAITPYLCYARQDHRIASGDPLALRYLAQLFEAIGTDRFVAIDVHNRASFENAFRIPIDHLEAARLLSAESVSSFGLDREDLVVVSPDIGGVKRARRFQAKLVELLQRDVALTAMGKRRLDHVVGADDVVPGVDDRIAVIVDDMIGTGETLSHAVAACRKGGARKVFAAATHGLFLAGAEALLVDPNLDGVVVADTVPPFRLCSAAGRQKLTVMDSTGLAAEAIDRFKG